MLQVPEDALREIEEYEEKEYGHRSGKRKRKYPSNEDIVEAIKNVSGRSLNRYNIDSLYDAVKQYLEERGFDTSALNESRFWRLVTNLAKKGYLKTNLE